VDKGSSYPMRNGIQWFWEEGDDEWPEILSPHQKKPNFQKNFYSNWRDWNTRRKGITPFITILNSTESAELQTHRNGQIEEFNLVDRNLIPDREWKNEEHGQFSENQKYQDSHKELNKRKCIQFLWTVCKQRLQLTEWLPIIQSLSISTSSFALSVADLKTSFS
jgi:hypothetical protein